MPRVGAEKGPDIAANTPPALPTARRPTEPLHECASRQTLPGRVSFQEPTRRFTWRIRRRVRLGSSDRASRDVGKTNLRVFDAPQTRCSRRSQFAPERKWDAAITMRIEYRCSSNE